MKEYSTKVQPIGEPVWLGLEIALSPPFMITPKPGKETKHIGIGREISLLLAKKGAKVAITDLFDKEGQALTDEIIKSNGAAKF